MKIKLDNRKLDLNELVRKIINKEELDKFEINKLWNIIAIVIFSILLISQLIYINT